MQGRITSAGVTGALTIALAVSGGAPVAAQEGWDVAGFVENVTHLRKGVGLSKLRNTVQIEFTKTFESNGNFTWSLNGTLRATYDGVYDFNSRKYGKNAGGAITLESTLFAGTPLEFLPHGGGFIPNFLPPGALPPGNTFGFDVAQNPNEGLIVLGQPLHGPDGGVAFGVPVRPCDVDPRGCLSGYMDATLNGLRYSDFNSRQDWLREFYVEGNFALDNGNDVTLRVGRQQVVWGRTDLFRVLDVINPVDYSRQNIYDELEDIRIPQWMATLDYRMGAVGVFEDLNVQFVWNFDKFRPSNLGQSGTPYQIIDAGSFFRGMKNCWDNGCTVSNFADGVIATDFGPGVIGIRNANLRKWTLDNSQYGMKVEGVYNSVGFSLNYLSYIQQLPVLRGGIPATNVFTGEQGIWPYLIAFDIDFPRVHLFGGSVDLYADSIKSVFRIEAAYTTGEEFANTLQPRLFSESGVFRYVIGWDRDTFIPFLNRTKAFLFSAQIFGQHLLDHELQDGAGALAGIPGFGKVGMPDWKDSWIGTLLIKGWWMNNRLSPQIITAYDFRAKAATFAPSIEYLVNDGIRLVFGANFKVGTGARRFDDCRTCNPFPPFTATPLQAEPGSVGLMGFEPLGRFRSGPLGMAQKEDEIQFSIRFSF